MTVVAFCDQLGIPRPTWYRWKAAGSSVKGPWPTPAQDAVEADAKTLASGWDAWGHRKLAELNPSLILPGHGPAVTDMAAFERFVSALPG